MRDGAHLFFDAKGRERLVSMRGGKVRAIVLARGKHIEQVLRFIGLREERGRWTGEIGASGVLLLSAWADDCDSIWFERGFIGEAPEPEPMPALAPPARGERDEGFY